MVKIADHWVEFWIIPVQSTAEPAKATSMPVCWLMREKAERPLSEARLNLFHSLPVPEPEPEPLTNNLF